MEKTSPLTAELYASGVYNTPSHRRYIFIPQVIERRHPNSFGGNYMINPCGEKELLRYTKLVRFTAGFRTRMGTTGMERGLKKHRRVLIAVDQSDESIHALSWALNYLLINDNADEDLNDKVILLHVQPPRKVFPEGSADVLESVQRCQRSITASILEKAKGICSAKNISAETKVVVGEARTAICEQVEKLQADLLIVGSHGHGRIKRVLMGSVSDYCVHNVKCPVVVVKRPRN